MLMFSSIKSQSRYKLLCIIQFQFYMPVSHHDCVTHHISNVSLLQENVTRWPTKTCAQDGCQHKSHPRQRYFRDRVTSQNYSIETTDHLGARQHLKTWLLGKTNDEIWNGIQ